MKKDFYKKSRKLYKEFAKEQHKKDNSIWDWIRRYIVSDIRFQHLKKLNAPKELLKNEERILDSRKEAIKNRIQLWVRYIYQFDDDYSRKSRGTKKDKVKWQDYLSAEERLLYAIFHKRF